MPISLQWEPHGVVRTFSGQIEFDEYMQSIAELQNDLRFDTLRFIVEDFSLATSVRIAASDVDMIIATTIGAAFSNPHIRIAAVAQEPTLRQLISLFSQTSPYVTQSFERLSDAREWIRDGETSPVPLDIQLQASVDFDTRPLIY